MKRILVLYFVSTAMIMATAGAALAHTCTVTGTNGKGQPGWTNTTAASIYWTSSGPDDRCYVSVDGVYAPTFNSPIPNPMNVSIPDEDGVHAMSVYFKRGTSGEILHPTITLDTVRPILKGHMSKSSYTRRQRPYVHFFVQEDNLALTSAVVKRSGSRVGSSRPGTFRSTWGWRTLPLFARTSSTLFKRGRYTVVLTTKDQGGNAQTKTLRFTVK